MSAFKETCHEDSHVAARGRPVRHLCDCTAAAGESVHDAAVRVYIYAGLKTHGEGQHDYPQFLADWSKLLMNAARSWTARLHFPTADGARQTDVIVIYKGDAGYMTARRRPTSTRICKRGGGLVSFHDALCGPDPEYFATLVGGAKKHGESELHARSQDALHDRRQDRSDHGGHVGLHASPTRRST